MSNEMKTDNSSKNERNEPTKAGRSMHTQNSKTVTLPRDQVEEWIAAAEHTVSKLCSHEDGLNNLQYYQTSQSIREVRKRLQDAFEIEITLANGRAGRDM